MLISTSDFFANLSYYLSFPFVRYALIVSTLIALCASLLGVTLVLKRYSFIGDGLSHVAFGAIAIASVFNLTSAIEIIGTFDKATILLALIVSYIARYKEHKEAGLADK